MTEEEPSTTPGQLSPDSNGADSTTGKAAHPAAIDMDAACYQFAEAISTTFGADVIPEPDGEIHRFDDPGKRNGNKNCWYYFNPSGTYGVYGNWGTDERYEWHLDDFEAIPEEELARIYEQAEAAQQQRALQRRDGQAKAVRKSMRMLKGARTAEQAHTYLQKKCIPPASALQDGQTLLIPVLDAEGNIRNLQQIAPNGKKRFLKGGEVIGNFALIGAEDLPTQGSIIVCEGWATGVTLHQAHGWPVAAAMNAGNLGPVCAALRDKLPDAVTIIVAADDDRHTDGNPGLTKAMAAGEAIGAEVTQPDFPCDDCDCTDFNDVAVCQQRKEGRKSNSTAGVTDSNKSKLGKKQPIPLQDALPPVKPLTKAMLPEGFVGFVADVSERLQIPADYIAICCTTVAAGILGAKRRIHPKQRDDWLVTPTQWGGLIGPPSSMKSACMGAALQPLHELEKEMTHTHEEAVINHQIDTELADDNRKEVKKQAKELYATDKEKAVEMIREATAPESPPSRQRYTINDATIEKVGELMQENPNGLLLVRDELAGWLAKMAQEDYQGDRAFYLECFEGNNPFVWDRIGRGTIVNEVCVLSILGGIQPSKIAPVIRNAIQGTIDDGLIQRFQLSVWPDVPRKWKWIDQEPDKAAYARYCGSLRLLHNLPSDDAGDPTSTLRFSTPAQKAFIAWMEYNQSLVRSDNLHPVMQAHLAKMPKTIAGLALLFEIIDGGREKVGKKATMRAILWADYLASHAERLYSLASNQGIDGARLILNRREKLPDIFTARDVQRKNWMGLSSKQAVNDALECLIEHRHITELPVPSSKAGGRPSIRYRWHPAVGKQS